MELKIQRDTKIMLALTEEEAAELSSVCALTPRGASPVADTLFDSLFDAGIQPNMGIVRELRNHIANPTL